MKRVFLVILDGVGAGALPDAGHFGDEGSNTLANTAEAVGGLHLPVMESWGLGNITRIAGVDPVERPEAVWGRMAEASPGKDTTTGHWEMMGVILSRPFPTYPRGFPAEVMAAFARATGREALGNKPASGTEIIEELGPEHLKTGRPIVYTSADSVFQIAAHEEVIPLPELYRICQAAREILQGEHMVSRVIARPFAGRPGAFYRTGGRKDFSVSPPEETLLDFISARGVKTIGVGKIEDIFNGRGLTGSFRTGGNRETIAKVRELVRTEKPPALIFANCVDFDSLYGHRNDAAGFARALEEIDGRLGEIAAVLGEEDLLIVTADHGNDPTTVSTDHSREYVPLLITGKRVKKGLPVGTRKTFADLSAAIARVFSFDNWEKGTPFPILA